jgi:predicted anti-sigma-YlaC factor YlaD
MGAHLPHLTLRGTNEGLKCTVVSIAGFDQQSGQMIHLFSIAPGTLFSTGSTVTYMNPFGGCENFIEALSASADQELDMEQERILATHLTQCAACRGLAEQFSALNRKVRLRIADPVADLVPDLASVVMNRARPARLGRGGWLRPALAWVAVVMGAQSLSPLFTSTVDGVNTHTARHLGAFALALAVGLAYVAWRPYRAIGLLPFALALVVTTMGAAAVDLWNRRSSALSESVHLTELIGVTILWMIAGSPGWERLRAAVRVRSVRAIRAS